MLKDFDQSQELKTKAKKRLQFYMFPTYDFRGIYLNWDQMKDGRWLESKDEYNTAFIKFC